MNPLLLILFALLLLAYAVWPSGWFIFAAAVVLILVAAFRAVVAR